MNNRCPEDCNVFEIFPKWDKAVNSLAVRGRDYCVYQDRTALRPYVPGGGCPLNDLIIPKED